MKHKNFITYTIILILAIAYVCNAQIVLWGGGWQPNSLADSNSTFSDTTSTGDWIGINGILSAENDSTLSFQDTSGSGYFYLPLTGMKKKKYRVQFDYTEGEENIVEGWDFTDGWVAVNSTAIKNAVMSSSLGYVRKNILENNEMTLYKIYLKGQTTCSSISVRPGAVVKMQITNATFDTSVIFTSSTLYGIAEQLRLVNDDAGTTTYEEFRLYKLQDSSQAVESAKLYYSIAGTTDSTNTITSSWQTETKIFKSKVDADSNYYKFDGVDDYISFDIDLATLYPDSFSVSGWVNFDDFDDYYTIVSNGRNFSSSSRVGWSFGYATNGKLYFDCYDTSATRMTATVSPPHFTAGNWGHYVITYKNGTQRIYINGVLKKEEARSEGRVDNSADQYKFAVGASYGGSTLYISGKERNIKFYPRELTASEIQTLYNGDSVSGAYLELPSKNITETTWTDASGNGNHGTANGATFRQTELKLWFDKQAKVKVDNVKLMEAK